jgi:hypothetical protein
MTTFTSLCMCTGGRASICLTDWSDRLTCCLVAKGRQTSLRPECSGGEGHLLQRPPHTHSHRHLRGADPAGQRANTGAPYGPGEMCIGFEYETASFEMLCCDIDLYACVQPIKYTLLLSQTDKRRDVSYTLAVYSTALPFMCVPCPPIPSNQVRDNHNPSLWTLSDLGDCAVKSAWVVDRKQCRWTHRQQQVLHQSTVQVAIVVPMSDICVFGCFF